VFLVDLTPPKTKGFLQNSGARLRYALRLIVAMGMDCLAAEVKPQTKQAGKLRLSLLLLLHRRDVLGLVQIVPC
jgi:hypothetical protein